MPSDIIADTAPFDFERSLAGRRCLVTGHTGFTGGWLCLWLSALGAKLSGLSLAPPTDPSLFEAADIGKVVSSHIGDICDAETVNAVFDQERPEIVFHLAAQPIVARAFQDPLESFQSNVMGTANVLEAARRTPGVEALVCVTTDKVYENKEWPWAYRETDRLGGKDPYSASKSAAEMVVTAYQRTLAAAGNGVRIASARGGNIIGGGDWAQARIVPDFVRAHISGEALQIRSPEAVRPWQHVAALCHGYMVLAEALLHDRSEAVGAWNFGPRDSEAYPVRALVDGMLSLWPGVPVEYTEASFPEAGFLRVDSSKAISRLDWQPPLTFAKTVKLTADWYRDYYRGGMNARELTERDLASYRQALKGIG